MAFTEKSSEENPSHELATEQQKCENKHRKNLPAGIFAKAVLNITNSPDLSGCSHSFAF